MDKHVYRIDQMTKRLFGPEAQIAGTIGTPRRQGELQIHVGGQILGRGRTFAETLRAATVQAAESVRQNCA